MRMFVGVEFNKELKLKLKSTQEIIKQYSRKGSWVNEDNFHITLKFLGKVDKKHVDEIGKVIENLSNKYAPIKLGLEGLGYFNNRKGEIRVLWVGLSGEVDKLVELYKYIDEETVKLGFSREKRSFNPHITLGRRIIFQKPFYEIKDIIYENLEYKFTLDTISLLKSEEIMKKRVYTPIKSNKLEEIHSS